MRVGERELGTSEREGQGGFSWRSLCRGGRPNSYGEPPNSSPVLPYVLSYVLLLVQMGRAIFSAGSEMRREAPRKIQCRASQRQLLVNNNNLNAGPGPAWFLLAPSCSFVLAVAGFCRREERQGKQVNQSTPSRHQSRSNSGAERREKMDVAAYIA